MNTIIPIEEEYGYRCWLWKTPDTFESAKHRFEDVIGDPDFFCQDPKDLDLGGEWKQISWDEYISTVRKTGISGHIHENNDSYIMRLKGYENSV